MIFTLDKGIKHFTRIFGTFQIKTPLIFNTFSKFEITPIQYFNGDPTPHCFTF